MKKRWIPFIIACMAVAFISGQFLGANAQAEHQEARVETRAIMQTTIAVINADTGSIVDGERQNFSAAIIDTLSDDFALVSPAMAYTGLSLGLYGAVITFPSHVSERVLSFNTHSPEQVRLEFQINPNLPEQDFIETYTKIMDLQMAINTTIAYTYVSSIFDQFHAAQDQVEAIFQNDMAHLEALGDVSMERFTASLQLDRLPVIPLNPNAPVTSHFMISVTDFAEQVADMYSNSFDTAVEDYLYMRSGLIAMTEHFPEQEREWMQALETWSDIFTQYGTDLQAYSDIVRRHQMDLEDWHMRASFWNEDLMWYQENLDEWFDDISDWNSYLLSHERDSFEWFMFASGWQDDLTMYQIDLENWYQLASIWNEQLITHDGMAMEWFGTASMWHEESKEHKSDVLDWKEDLQLWNDDAEVWHNLSQDYLDVVEAFGVDVYNHLTNIIADYNDAVYYLENWLDAFQVNSINTLLAFAADYNYHVYEMQDVHDGLTDWQIALGIYVSNLQSQVNSLLSAMTTTIPPIPNISSAPDPYTAKLILLDWHYNATAAMVVIDQMIMGIDGNIPALYYGTPVLSPLNLPQWNYYITLPPILYIYIYGNNFILPYMVMPDPKDLPPSFQGLQQPDIVDAPPELVAYQPNEPPILDTDQPYSPPRITELPPLSAIQPVIQQPGDPARLEANQPGRPIENRPPRPDDFWASFNDMHRQLMRFNPDDYLTSAYRWEVQRMLWDYERYMDTVRFDLASQFDDNINMLHDIRFEYTDFLTSLRAAALQAEAETIDQLQNTINVFAQRVEYTSEDTRYRLQSFAGMMPESRTPLGPNRNLTRFAVAPFDIVTPQLRELAAAAPVEVEAESIAGTFENHLWIAVSALGIVLVVTLGSYGVTWFRKRGEE